MHAHLEFNLTMRHPSTFSCPLFSPDDKTLHVLAHSSIPLCYLKQRPISTYAKSPEFFFFEEKEKFFFLI